MRSGQDAKQSFAALRSQAELGNEIGENMAMLSAKMQVENHTQKPRIVWIEPWAEDYTLLPKENLEIIARCANGQPWFFVVEHGDSTQVYLEATSDFDVFQNGKRLICGHNRKAALDAGVKY